MTRINTAINIEIKCERLSIRKRQYVIHIRVILIHKVFELGRVKHYRQLIIEGVRSAGIVNLRSTLPGISEPQITVMISRNVASTRSEVTSPQGQAGELSAVEHPTGRSLIQLVVVTSSEHRDLRLQVTVPKRCARQP
ncbi:hypothetical protein D3C87_1589240 [compost metagenome]